MPHDRYFTDSSLANHQTILLDEEESHHLHVMRKREDDLIEVVNGQNCLATARIEKIEKKQTTLLIESVQHFTPPLPLILAQAFPRLNRLDDIIEKGVELGVTEFWLFPGDRSEKKDIKEKDLARLKRMTISALKQCGRYDLPSIVIKEPIHKIKSLPYPGYFGDLSSDAPLFKQSWHESHGDIFFIGPESGFSDNEVQHLKALNMKGVRLHPYILRTDTASYCALSLLQHARM